MSPLPSCSLSPCWSTQLLLALAVTQRGQMLQLALADLISPCKICGRHHQSQGVEKQCQFAPTPQRLGAVAEALISFRAPEKPGPKRGRIPSICQTPMTASPWGAASVCAFYAKGEPKRDLLVGFRRHEHPGEDVRGTTDHTDWHLTVQDWSW